MPALDHFGLSVGTPAELYETLERARKFRERDPRVEIIDPEIEDYKVLKLHNFYVRYPAAADGRGAVLRVGRGRGPREPARRLASR